MVHFVAGDPLPDTLTLIVRKRLIFACLIFVARTDYENILTAKISRFTVSLQLCIYSHDSGANSAAIVGGGVGAGVGVTVLLIITIVTVVAICVCIKRSREKSKL